MFLQTRLFQCSIWNAHANLAPIERELLSKYVDTMSLWQLTRRCRILRAFYDGPPFQQLLRSLASPLRRLVKNSSFLPSPSFPGAIERTQVNCANSSIQFTFLTKMDAPSIPLSHSWNVQLSALKYSILLETVTSTLKFSTYPIIYPPSSVIAL